MRSEQNNNRNRISTQKIAVCAILASLCIVLGYLESLVSLNFIAPGIKLGLANSVALILVCKNDFKGAIAVNITRIFLSALLFGSPMSLLFSFVAGMVSLILVWLFSKLEFLGVLGLSIIGGVAHNIVQCFIASAILGREVFLYLPLLILSGTLSGSLVGMISGIVLKKLETNEKL